MDPLISVIVPFYNSESHLKYCIQSILNQTYANFELILIDDGSVDSSLKICEDYRSIDSRIIIIHKKNEGPGVARNIGLNIAKGDYISFIDSDDFVHPQYLEILKNSISRSDYDIAMCGNLQTESRDSFFEKIKDEDLNPISLSKEEMFNKIFSDWRYIVVWGKLFKKDFIGEKRFINQYYAEDLEFIISLTLKSNLNIFLSNPLYYQVVSKSSLTASPLPRRYTDHLSGLQVIYDNMPSQFQIFREKILETLFLDMLYLKYHYYKNNNKDINLLFKSARFSLARNFYFAKYIPLKSKLIFFFLSIPGMYKTYLKFYIPFKNLLK